MQRTECMLKRKHLKREIVGCSPPPLIAREIPLIPPTDQVVPSVSPELVEVPSTVVKINPDSDTTKLPVSNTHSVGTAVKVTLLDE